MRKLFIFTISMIGLILPESQVQAQSQPLSLFNGSDLTGWHADVPDMDKDASLKSPFIVRNELLVSLGKPGGHLITDSIPAGG